MWALLEIVPKRNPVIGLMYRPLGRPEAAQRSVPPLLSVAATWKATSSPAVFVWLPGLVMTTAPDRLMLQLKLSTALFVPSPTVTVGVNEPAMLTVPVMAPVLELIDRPLLTAGG